jgi:hypothetical protein
MPVSYLRLVPTAKPASAATAFDRIEAAIDRMMADADRMRIAARRLRTSSRELFAIADQIEAKIPLFADAEARLLVERDRAYEIANDAAIIERRILQSSPGNLAPLTSGLPSHLNAAAAQARAA